MAESLVTPEARASFVYVFDKDKNGKYSMSLLFPPGSDLGSLKKMAAGAADAKWGAKKPANLKSPFLDAGAYDYKGYEKGWTVIRCTTMQRPGVVAAHADPKTGRPATITDPAQMYSGCWVRAQVGAYAYDKDGNRGVSFGLRNVQKIRDDEQLGGAGPAEKAFEAIAGADDAGGTSAEDIFASA